MFHVKFIQLSSSQMKMKKILLTPKREFSPQNSKVLGNGKLLLRFKREIICQYNDSRAKVKSYILFDGETKSYLVLSYLILQKMQSNIA